jgi:perosamine synthetase
MNTNYIPVNTPFIGELEKKYLIECIESGWISSEGPFIKKFEDLFAEKMGRKYAIAVSNGTVAIDISIESLGLKKGDEVIMPAFTIISCVNQIIRLGAVPVLVDSDLTTWNMDVTQIESKITSRTRAIMVVHIYGLPVDMDPLFKIAKKYKLKVIEDASEMHGQNYKNKPCGSFGDISTFSFYANKHITTGEGGMILTDDKNIADSCRSYRNLCFKPEKRFVHDTLGWNARMTSMQAAIGLAQLEQLEEFVKKKRILGTLYTEKLSKIRFVDLPLQQTNYAINNYWVYGILIKENANLTAEKVMDDLNKLGIGTRPFFCPMNQQPVLKKMGLFKNEEYPNADYLYKYGFYIPSGMALTENQIDLVGNIVLEYFNNIFKNN